LRTFLTLIAVCLGSALSAEAQIYTWRDASGQLVLSNRPQGSASDGREAVVAPRRPSGSPRDGGGDGEGDGPYDDIIREHSVRHGVSPELVRAVIRAESGFNPHAISPKGAMGLMQLMPATARELGVANPFHPEQNIRGGVTYLARLLARYEGNLELALAAYNAGPASVERYGAVPPYRETQGYVKRITRATREVTPAPPPPPIIYKWIEEANGQRTARYSNVAPKDTPYEIVGR
jgi:soluble lytic murein transglycosylase-like protein